MVKGSDLSVWVWSVNIVTHACLYTCISMCMLLMQQSRLAWLRLWGSCSWLTQNSNMLWPLWSVPQALGPRTAHGQYLSLSPHVAGRIISLSPHTAYYWVYSQTVYSLPGLLHAPFKCTNLHVRVLDKIAPLHTPTSSLCNSRMIHDISLKPVPMSSALIYLCVDPDYAQVF